MENWFSDLRNLTNDRIFIFLAFTSFLCISAFSLISPALPAIAEGVSVTEAEIGLLITAFTLPSIFILPFSGFLADNFGRNKVMSLGSFMIGLGGIAAFITTDFQNLVLIRVFQGIGFAGVMPLTVALIGDLYDGSKQTQALGLKVTSHKIGDIIWPLTGGFLAALSWNNVFLVYSLFIPVGIIAYFKIPSRDSKARSPTDYMNGMKDVIERPKIMALLFTGFSRMFIKFSILTYIPVLLASRYSISSGRIGVYMTLLGFGGLITATSAGLFDQRYGKKKSLLTSLLVIGFFAFLVSFTQMIEIVILMMLFYGLFDSLMSPIHKSLLNENVEDEHRTGLITTNSLAQNLGSTMAPVTIGALLFINSEIWLYIITGLSITTVTAYLIVDKNNTKPE